MRDLVVGINPKFSGSYKHNQTLYNEAFQAARILYFIRNVVISTPHIKDVCVHEWKYELNSEWRLGENFNYFLIRA